MSQAPSTPSSSSSSSSNFQFVFNAALDAYEKKTKNSLLTHPLIAQLQSCDSPDAILSVLQGLIQQFDQHRSSDERLRKWLNPTVNVVYAFSATLSAGVSLVSLNLPSDRNLCSDFNLSGIFSSTSGICWYRRPSLGKPHIRSFRMNHRDTNVY